MARRVASSWVGGVIGSVLLASSPFFATNYISRDFLKGHKNGIESISAVLFGIVLIWWSLCDGYTGAKRKGVDAWGIGNETVSMVVAVVAAVIAIVTLLESMP